MLSDAAKCAAAYDDIERIMAADGALPAFTRFLSMNGLLPDGGVPLLAGGDPPTGTEPPPGCVQTLDGVEFMMTREMRAFVDYHIDFTRLTSGGVPVTLAGGNETRDRYYCRTGEVIAGRLGGLSPSFPAATSAS